jgi:hypothetical protein
MRILQVALSGITPPPGKTLAENAGKVRGTLIGQPLPIVCGELPLRVYLASAGA